MDQATLKQLLRYDPDTGEWFWLNTSCTKIKPGMIAGNVYKHGYRIINIDRKKYQSSRLAFLYQTGQFPERFVDHIDGNPSNDRWINLRESTPSENQFNKKLQKNNSSGQKGVSWCKRKNKWYARIWHNRKTILLGYFASKEEAIKVRKEAEITYHGNFRRA